MYKSNIISFFVGVIITVAIAFAFNISKKTVQEHVYLDIERIIKELTIAVVNKNLSQKESEIKVKAYKQRFDKELKAYAKEHNVVIFSSPKPIAGGRDVTDYFIGKLIREKKNEKG